MCFDLPSSSSYALKSKWLFIDIYPSALLNFSPLFILPPTSQKKLGISPELLRVCHFSLFLFLSDFWWSFFRGTAVLISEVNISDLLLYSNFSQLCIHPQVFTIQNK